MRTPDDAPGPRGAAARDVRLVAGRRTGRVRARHRPGDYNVEGVSAESTAYCELASRLCAEGVPVQGLGTQGHLGIQYGFPGGVADRTALRFDCSSTEFFSPVVDTVGKAFQCSRPEWNRYVP
ncbi:endo-1,4-beta-xylanase [Streptomyces sp. NPDC002092]